jgi:hypothetical protein
MKRLIFILSFLFAFTSMSYAQSTVGDAYPAASIFALDYQSGEQYPATNDAAILFKNAFIKLAINTGTARMYHVRQIPGRKNMIITQADPKSHGTAFQLSLQNNYMGQTSVVYTFLYNVDQNTLYHYDPGTRNWVPDLVQGNNVLNLNACLQYGNFNDPNAQRQTDVTGPQSADNNSADYDAAVDTAAVADNPPPALPEYEQPACPTDGYLWQPGYWAFHGAVHSYYWVPGVWVAPPTVGYLWTPPYWGFFGGHYAFHAGYWGPTIGFYGGINYGFGYVGVGFIGGEWHGGLFRYNTAVVRVNTVSVHNTYVNTTVINRTVVNNRVSFNGGPGGVAARPTDRELAAVHENHIAATPEQTRNQWAARSDRSQFASANGGKPGNLASANAPARPAVNNNAAQRPAMGQRSNAGNAHGGTMAAGQRSFTPQSNLPGAPSPNTPGTKGQKQNGNRGSKPHGGGKDKNKR